MVHVENPMLRYVWTGLILISTVVVWLVLGTVLGDQVSNLPHSDRIRSQRSW
jgi:hypothetical protein